MCGRVKLSPLVLPAGSTEGELALGEIGLIGAALSRRASEVELFNMQWGIKLPLGKPVFHARFETVADKPMWSHLFVNGRGVLFTRGWYERGLFIHRGEGEEIALAVLWSRFPAPIDKHFVMLTQASAGSRVAGVHERMPVVVNPTEWFAGGITIASQSIDLQTRRESHA